MFVNKVDRPKKFEDYIGQDNIIANLRIYIASSKKQAKVLDHIIIHGPSGMGKTSLANLISLEMKKRIIILVLEVIYPVLENNELSVILGKDYNSKIVNIKLQPFTLICATTEINKLPLPFVNRFSINFQLQPYSRNDITKIIINYAKNINFELKYEIANFIARFTKNNPRIAINIIKRIYDYYIIENPAEVSITYIKSILQKLQIWKFGLSNIDVRYLKILAQHGTLGIDSISQILDLPVTIIINTIEPVLVKNVLIVKSSKGRTITDEGRKFLNSMAIDK
jgi:Holliday junction DNA helicase RuvB